MNPTVTQMPSNGEEVYTGDLPCADCEGIDAVLTLRQNGTYTSSNTYRGRDVEPYVENGTWKMITGDATDPNAEVYELSPDNPNATKQYYRVSGNELQQLDTDLNPIEAPFNTSLTKQSE